MRRALGPFLVLTMVLGFAAGCGGDDESSDGSSTPTAAGSSDDNDSGDSGGSSGSSDTGNAQVDEYCDQVDEVIAAVERIKDDPSSADAQATGDRVYGLSAGASDLIDELTSDPDLADAVTECAQKLEQLRLG